MTRRGATKGAVAIGAIGAALYLAARTTGAGWLVVILCGLIAVLAVSVVWPRVALARVRVAVTAPTDATAGEPVDIRIATERAGLGVRLLPLDPPGEVVAVVGNGVTTADVVPPRRAVLSQIEIEVSSAAPFGLVWWRRRRQIALSRPIAVAPRRPSSGEPIDPVGGESGDHTRALVGRGDQVRSIRDYAHGDPLRLVHWPATARRGQVMVKELEQPDRPRLVVAVDLSGADEQIEAIAERAMATIGDAIESGHDVVLITAERTGPVNGTVTSVRELGRRLAYATPGPVAAPAGEAVHVISGKGRWA